MTVMKAPGGRRRASLLAAALSVAACAALSAAPRANASTPKDLPALAGDWVLDRSRSDDPREKMAAGRPGPRGGPGRRGGGGRGPGGGSGGPPGEGPEGRPGGGRFGPGGGPDSSRMERVFHPAATLEIRETPNGLRLAEPERDPRRVLIVDQKPESKIAPDVFYRDGRKLVEVAPLGPRRRLRETYELSKDGRTLTVVSRLEGDGGRGRNVEFKRVYQRAQEPGATP